LGAVLWLLDPEGDGTASYRNSLPDNTASHLRRLGCSATLLWELKTSHYGII